MRGGRGSRRLHIRIKFISDLLTSWQVPCEQYLQQNYTEGQSCVLTKVDLSPSHIETNTMA